MCRFMVKPYNVSFSHGFPTEGYLELQAEALKYLFNPGKIHMASC